MIYIALTQLSLCAQSTNNFDDPEKPTVWNNTFASITFQSSHNVKKVQIFTERLLF